MSLHRTMSQRKAASTFINDNTDINLIQFSPRKKPCHSSPYTMTSNQEPKANFIGHSILNNDRARAIVVSTTGEKHMLDLDDCPIPKSSSNAFTRNSPRYSGPTMERISEKSSSQLSLTETSRRKNSKFIKKPKLSKRCAIQKHRLVFTPRNVERGSSVQISPVTNENQITSKLTNSQYFENSKHHSTATQTECSSCHKFTTTRPYNNYIPMEGRKNNCTESSQRHRTFYTTATPPPLKPLKIYTKCNYNLGKYSELRNLGSALTLITVVSWLFATFFDIECLWDYLDSFFQYFQSWFLAKDTPKTKLEILMTFLQELWS